jgi:glycosyltransferase involved in cell wall biosynthesis
MEKKIKIAINAQIVPNSGIGGVESVVIGLVTALGKLNDGNEEYIIICDAKYPDWLKPYLGKNEIIVCRESNHVFFQKSKVFQKLSDFLLKSLRIFLLKLLKIISPQFVNNLLQVQLSDGFYEKLKCDVIHFPYQDFTICSIPSIYNPHDLQHLHFPQFFSPGDIAYREKIYPAGCHYSRTIAVASEWIKNDIIENYGISPHKIQVIPMAPVTAFYSEITSEKLQLIKNKYKFYSNYIFYPAMTWEHKNHIRLIEALALIRDTQDLKINLVCSGGKTPYWGVIESKITELNLWDQVNFIGLVPRDDLRYIYHLSDFVVLPTLFEAASGPLFEAWQEGVAVACSSVTSLPEQAGNAAIIFDPFSVEGIAEAILSLNHNPELRKELIKRGKRRLEDFSWEKTAKAYRAVYRKAANIKLSDEDVELLKTDWMKK